MKYILNEDTPKRYILSEDASQADRIKLSLAFEKLFRAEAKNEKAFTDTKWDYKTITRDDQQLAKLNDFLQQLKTTADKAKLPTVGLLWDAYYAWLWGKDAASIRKLGDTFINQLTIKGFSEANNEFLGYLRWIYKYKNYSITPQAYNAIHNLRQENKLSKEDLTIPAKGLPEKVSLAICPTVLKLSSGNQVYQLVTLSKDLIKKIGDGFEFALTDSKNVILKLDSKAQLGLLSLIFNANNPELEDALDNLESADKIRTLAGRTLSRSINSLSNPEDAKCILNTGATIRDNKTINAIVKTFVKSISKLSDDKKSEDEESKTVPVDDTEDEVSDTTTKSDDAPEKDTETYKEYWETLKRDIGDNPRELETFFSFVLMTKATSLDTYKALSKFITKKFYGTEAEELEENTEIWRSNLETYTKLVKELSLTPGKLKAQIKKLFQAIPAELKAEESTDSAGGDTSAV